MESVKNHVINEDENIYLYALQFSRMYDRVVESQNRVPASTENAEVINAHKMKGTIVAELVNLAFADELYLKAILKHEKANYRHEHRLDKLYNLLSKEAQKDIKDTTVNMYKNISGQDVDFDDFLVKNANIFVDWRYAFEKSASASVDLFVVFSTILKVYATDIFYPEATKNVIEGNY